MAKPVRKIDYAPVKSGEKRDGTWVEDIRLRMDQTYAKKPRLKAADLELELNEIQQQEWMKCALDVVYFVENYYRITTIDNGFVLFQPYEYQKELLQAFQDHRFNIVCQCRQSGKTTVVAAFLLWYALFHPDKEIAILANKERQAREIIDRMQKALQDLPFFLQSGLEKYGSTEMAFENGSKVFVYATSPDAIRGRSCSIVYLDEFAFVDGDEEFWESVYPTIASGKSSRCIITSTPKGKRGMFYGLWAGANEPDENGNTNGFNPTLVKWFDVPPYRDDPTFEESTRARLGDSRFNQEMLCDFRGSVGTLIPSQLLMAMRSKEVTELNEFTKVLYDYNPDHSYVAVGDVGGGLEQDYSVLTIFDVTEIPYKIAAKYRCNTISPLLFPFTMVDMCNHYGQCPLLVETNNDVGGQAITVLWYDLEYLETIMTSNDPKRGGSGTRVGGKGAKPGIKTTSRVRNIGCSNLKGLIETGKLEIEDMDTIDELSTFILKNDKYQADEGCHDDCVMTLVLFSWLVKQDWFEDLYSVNVSQEMKKTASEKAIEALIPFGGTGGMGSQPVVRRQTGGMTTLEGSSSQMNEWAKS
ncbi:terminase large subunit [Vibrio phage vB_VcorM_GR28A]|nr:terminase large subunit [Vibrio phage vB_VcorM_GR28A]